MVDLFQMYKDKILTQPVAIIRATALSKHRVVVTFNTGETKLYDFTPLLNRPVFRPLQDELFFRDKMFIDGDTIAWPGDIDIDPEDVYVEGKPLRQVTSQTEQFSNVPQTMVG